MGRTLSFANQKGGVGKTTTAFNIACALHKKGKKVLIVDNDPQANLTSYALQPGQELHYTIDELYVARRKEKDLSLLLTSLDDSGFKILPSDPALAGVEYYLATRSDKEFILKQALSGVIDIFDFILIDNPPALNLLTINGLVASDEILIPVQLEYFSLEGIVLLQKTIESVSEKNPHLKLLGIIPNMFDDRRKLNLEVLDLLEKEFGHRVFKTRIHNSVKIAESSGHGQSVISYSPTSRAASEYIDMATEILERV